MDPVIEETLVETMNMVRSEYESLMKCMRFMIQMFIDMFT